MPQSKKLRSALKAIRLAHGTGLLSEALSDDQWDALQTSIADRDARCLPRLVRWGVARMPSRAGSRLHLTPAGIAHVDDSVDPEATLSPSGLRLSQFQIAILKRLYRPPFFKPIWGWEIDDPHQLRALQGLCRWPQHYRLVTWRALDGQRENLTDEMENTPKDCQFSLTSDGKLWGEGKLTFEVYTRRPAPLEIVRRPPSPKMLEKIIDGTWDES